MRVGRCVAMNAGRPTHWYWIVPMVGIALILLQQTFSTHINARALADWSLVASLAYAVIAMFVLVPMAFRNIRGRQLARRRAGCSCTMCEYSLPDDESGTCPECGTSYTRQSNAAFWGVPYTKPGAQENQDEPSEPRPEEQTEHGNKSS